MALLVVRHAKAGDHRRWDGPDHLRPLTAKGVVQSEGLVPQLAGFPLDRVLSSPFVRCIQTVEPIALERGLPVEPCDDLAEGAGAAALDLVRRLAGAGVVLCTHGDVIGDLLAGLGRPDGSLEKGSTWIVEPRSDGSMAMRYLPPPT